MSEEPAAPPPQRRPRRLTAFFLNVILPPSGYLYAGSLRNALIYVLLAACFPATMVTWTWFAPPGPLGLVFKYKPQAVVETFLVIIAVILISLGLNAAAIAGRRKKPVPTWRTTGLLAGALILAPFVLEAPIRDSLPISIYTIQYDSMQPTLTPGDVAAARGSRLFCGKVDVHPGDIVMYQVARSRTFMRVQRAIAGPGSLVSIRQGVVFVDSKPLNRVPRGAGYVQYHLGAMHPVSLFDEQDGAGPPYRIAISDASGPLENTAPVRVPKDSWFVLGDSRDNAADSRSLGPTPLRTICSVVERFAWTWNTSRIGLRP